MAVLTEGRKDRAVLQKTGRVVRKSRVQSAVINFVDQDITILKAQGISRVKLLQEQFEIDKELVGNISTIESLSDILNSNLMEVA